MDNINTKTVLQNSIDCEHCSIKTEQEVNRLDYNGMEKKTNIRKVILLGLGAGIFGIGLVFDFSFRTELILFITSYILTGWRVLLIAVRNIVRGQVFEENFLMSVATIGAFAIGEFPEGVAVMLFYQIGEFFESMAVNHSRRSIKSLMNIRPDYVNLKTIEGEKRVTPGEVEVGDLIIIKPGERVPLDGKIVEGRSMLDTSALTGEPMPREVGMGDEILSGSINKNSLLTVEVTKKYYESTVARILEMVQNASSRKAPAEKFITKFARYYTPLVVFGALALAMIPPLVLYDAVFSDWIYRALIFLVISCPCALVISIPMGFFGGIGGASKKGILIKGSNYLEALNSVDTVIFDKTGTLTKGVFKVTEVYATNGFNEKELMKYAAFAESRSNHPVAISILKAFGENVNNDEIEHYEEITGNGIRAKVRGKVILAGNTRLMEAQNIKHDRMDTQDTAVHIAVDGTYAGFLRVSDEIREDSKVVLKSLRNIGIRKIYMVTGDKESVGLKVGSELGVDKVYAEILPHQKVEKLEELNANSFSGRKIMFVGDGINDAPVLARADIGVAMGGLGSDAAIEAADIVLITDELSKLVMAIKTAKRTRLIVWQNIVFALAVKSAVLLLGALGIATMWEAVFADVGVTVIAVINSMRAINNQGDDLRQLKKH